MTTGLAYLIVVLVWATTPLGVKWSAEAGSPIGSLVLRMLVALVFGLLLLAVIRRPLRWHRRALLGYAAAIPSVFGAMALCYLAAPHVPSGLISVIYGSAPMMSGLMLRGLPGSSPFSRWSWAGTLLGALGLAVIFSNSLAAASAEPAALLMLLGAAAMFSLGGIAVQRVGSDALPLEQTLGTLCLCLPLFLLFWLASGEPLMPALSVRGLWAVLYLGLFGSLVSLLCYFVVLSRLSAVTTSLMTLITPLLALLLGYFFNAETPSLRMLWGAGLILAGLGAYLLGGRARRGRQPARTDLVVESAAKLP